MLTEKQKKQYSNPEFKKKISETLKRKYASGEIINPMTGKKNPKGAEWNRKNKKGKSTWNKGINGDEYLSHFKNKKQWKNNLKIGNKNKSIESKAAGGIAATLKQSKSKISKAEIKFKNLLIKKSINFIHQFPYKLGVADFYLPEFNLIIECYGEYWHKRPDYIERDIKKNNWLEKNGYNILILWSEDIMESNELNQFTPFFE